MIFLLSLVACGDDSQEADQDSGSDAGVSSADESSLVNRVDEVVAQIASGDVEPIRGQSLQIEAYISHPARTEDVSSSPPQGCPVVPERLEQLTDEPVETRIEVAGAELPNRLSDEVSTLRLVVPYTLGFVEIPQRAVLRGTVLDDEYAGCPGHERLFILEEIVEVLPVEESDEPVAETLEWTMWSHDDARLSVEYPRDWTVDEREQGGTVAYARFIGPDEQRPIRLRVEPGETLWHPDANTNLPPSVLRGDYQEPAVAGPAMARLVADRSRTATGEQELRLVFNHQGNTVTLAMIVSDGMDLNREVIAIFSEIAHRLRLDGEITISDPMDPVLAATDEVGEGPFLSQEEAIQAAVGASGMTGAEALEVELVSERDARMAVSGACRNFEGDAEGIWLVTVQGTLPSGREAYLLVYLNAATGAKLCQAEAPGAS